MKKNKSNINNALAMLILAAAGGCCGFLFTDYASSSGGLGHKLAILPLFFLLLYAELYLQVVLHEAGHLLFGLISGYRFVSFRVGSFMLTRQNGAFRLKRLSLAGTSGQCLMAPPELANGKMPVALYNMGGVIVNAVTSVLLLPAAAGGSESWFSIAAAMFSTIGIAFALINGIPLKFMEVDNDGRNALSLSKDPQAMRGFWIQLAVNAELAEGKRLRELPEEWFAVPDGDSLKNSMAAAIAVFSCNRLMDEARLNEAKERMEGLLEMETGMAGVHREMLRSDALYCELMGENRYDVVEKSLDKQLKSLMKNMRKMPSIMRTQYALALLHENDAAKAEKLRAQFDKIAASYPYEGDVQGERELLDMALERSKKERPLS